jgi:2-hydroxy-3-keto-5-methylthiopentenyl-1-phosphate phosphatase
VSAVNNKHPIIFCDFDGTITLKDNIVAIMKHFDPPGWKDMFDRFYQQQLTLRECVGGMFALIPSSRKDEVIQFVLANAQIRDGFGDFVAYCKSNQIQLLITSGGIDFFVYPLLKPYLIPQEHIFCNQSTFEGENFEILWQYRCDEHCSTDCGMCKTTIIRRYDPLDYHRILIGDSVSDFQGAKLVDTIFARHDLVTQCEELGLPYFPYDNFHDIIQKLEEIPYL